MSKERIEEIHKDRYNNFEGRAYWKIRDLYKKIRKQFGDDAYLSFLEKQIKINPKPKYQIPTLDSPRVHINNNRLKP